MNVDHQTKERLRRILTSDAVKTGHAMIRVIGGLTRYRIIVLLNGSPSGLAVTQIAKVLGASPSQISHQLRILKKNDLITGEPQGRTITYRLNKKRVKPFLV